MSIKERSHSWSSAFVLKTNDPKGSVGSNPTLSAKNLLHHISRIFKDSQRDRTSVGWSVYRFFWANTMALIFLAPDAFNDLAAALRVAPVVVMSSTSNICLADLIINGLTT